MAASVAAAAIVIAFLSAGLDPRFKVGAILALVLLLLADVLLRFEVFRSTSEFWLTRRRRSWIRRHGILVNQVRTLTAEANYHVGAATTTAGGFPAVAQIVIEYAKSGTAGAPSKMERVYRTWHESRAGWPVVSDVILQLTRGPGRKDTYAFLLALGLLRSEVAVWLVFVSNFVTEARSTGVTFPEACLDVWSKFTVEGNALRSSIYEINLEVSREFPDDLSAWNPPSILGLNP